LTQGIRFGRNAMLHGGLSVQGYTVGVLHLASKYPLPPGNPQNVRTFNFPVCFEAVPLEDPLTLMSGDESLLPLIVAAAQRLVERGVRVIAGACGSFAYYQKAIAATVSVPVFTSVLTQIPLVLSSLGGKPLGVVAASAHAVNERVFRQCGVGDSSAVYLTEMRGQPEFDRMLAGCHPMDVERLQQELEAVTDRFMSDHPDIGALLLQCSDLAPFASLLQYRFGLPVFDAVGLIRWLHHAVAAPVQQNLTR